MRRLRGPSAFLFMAAIVLIVGLTAVPAFGGGSVNLSVNIVPSAVKSLNVTPSSLSYGSCVGGSSTGSQLGFPNGACDTGSVTVTNTGAPALIQVAGQDMIPSDNGTHWTLCRDDMTCSQNIKQPTQDRYYETVSPTSGENSGATPGPGPFLALSSAFFCDTIFNAMCAQAFSGQAATEFLAITGPSSSTDSSPSFSTAVGWLAS